MKVKNNKSKLCVSLLIVLLLIGTIITMDVSAGGVIEFTIAGGMTEKQHIGQGVVKFLDLVKEKSGGELVGTFYSGGVLGKDETLVEELSIGSIEMFVGGAGIVIRHFAPEYQAMEAEYIFNDMEHARKTFDGKIGEELNKILIEKGNIKLFGVMERGARHIASKKPIYHPDDMKGLKIRVTNPFRAEVFKTMGAQPIAISYAELYGALMTGVVDAKENPIQTIYADSFYEVTDYLIKTGHVYVLWGFSYNNDWFNSLAPNLQLAIQEAFKEAQEWHDAENRKMTLEAERMLEEKGMTIIREDEIDMEAFQEKAMIVLEGYKKEWKPGLVEAIRALAE